MKRHLLVCVLCRAYLQSLLLGREARFEELALGLELPWERADRSRGVILLEVTRSGRRREVPLNSEADAVMVSGPREAILQRDRAKLPPTVSPKHFRGVPMPRNSPILLVGREGVEPSTR